MTMTLHNYRSRQFHRTSNGINPSSGFRNMGSAKSGPSAAWFDKFLAHGQAHMGQMGKLPWQCTTTGLDNSIELRMEKIRQAVTEIWVPQVWQPPARPAARKPAHPPARPPARPPEPWRQYPSSPKGWGVKTNLNLYMTCNLRWNGCKFNMYVSWFSLSQSKQVKHARYYPTMCMSKLTPKLLTIYQRNFTCCCAECWFTRH